MKLRYTIFSISLFLIFSACNNKSSKSSEKIDLQLNYKKGETHTIVTETETESNALGHVNERTEIKFTVDSIAANGDYLLTTNILLIKSDSYVGGNSDGYDSGKEESKMSADELSMHYELKPYLNTPLTLILSKKGKLVKGFTNPEGRVLDEPVDMAAIQLVFPENEVSVDDEWTAERTNPITRGKITSIYRIKEITKDKIMITSTSVIAAIGGLMKETKASGEYTLDRNSGRLLTARREMEMQFGGGKVIHKIYEIK